MTGRPQTKALASEKSLPVSLPALEGARRDRAGQIVLIRASLRGRLQCRLKALPWWYRGEEQPAVGLLPALPEGLAQEALLPSPGPPGGRLRSPPALFPLRLWSGVGPSPASPSGAEGLGQSGGTEAVRPRPPILWAAWT